MRYFLALILLLVGGLAVFVFGGDFKGAILNIPSVKEKMTDTKKITITLPKPKETERLLDQKLK